MRTYCDSWNCPVCRKRKAHHWAQNVYYGWCLWRPRPFYFLTFTMPGWMKTPEQGYEDLPRCWDNLRQDVVKTTGWFVYAAFVEEQALNRDMPHLHVVTLSNLPTRLNELALHCGFGYQARNLLMDGAGAAYYVTKYASKSLTHAPKKFRRVRASNIWPRLPDPILPNDYIPMETGEKIKPYVQRCAAELGVAVGDMMDRYTNHAIDVGSM